MEKPIEKPKPPPKPCRYCGKLLTQRTKHEAKCKINYS